MQEKEAGVVLHLARSGRLIIKAGAQVRDGSILIDASGRKTCRVIENIGPVSSPYLSTQPLTDRIERVVGQKLFVGEFEQYKKRDRRLDRSNKGRGGKSSFGSKEGGFAKHSAHRRP